MKKGLFLVEIAVQVPQQKTHRARRQTDAVRPRAVGTGLAAAGGLLQERVFVNLHDQAVAHAHAVAGGETQPVVAVGGANGLAVSR